MQLGFCFVFLQGDSSLFWIQRIFWCVVFCFFKTIFSKQQHSSGSTCTAPLDTQLLCIWATSVDRCGRNRSWKGIVYRDLFSLRRKKLRSHCRWQSSISTLEPWWFTRNLQHNFFFSWFSEWTEARFLTNLVLNHSCAVKRPTLYHRPLHTPLHLPVSSALRQVIPAVVCYRRTSSFAGRKEADHWGAVKTPKGHLA